jgi:suppressor of fused
MEQGREWIEGVIAEHVAKRPGATTMRFTDHHVTPLAAIHVHDHPRGEWHYITVGLTELGGKISGDITRSGWGFELTLRVRGDTDSPPQWPVRVLQQLASYVFETRNPFAVGHHMDLDAALDEEMAMFRALAFVDDVELAPRDGPNGRVAFLQVVALYEDEERLAAHGALDALIEALRERDPSLAIDPRPSLASAPEALASMTAGKVAAAIATTLSWRREGLLRRGTEVRVGPGTIARRNLLAMLDGRTTGAPPIRIYGEGRTLELRFDEMSRWDEGVQRLEVVLSPDATAALRAFLASEGVSFSTPHLRGLTLRLV